MIEREEDLAGVIAGASEPMRIVGGSTRPIGNTAVGEPLPVSGLSGVTLYEPGALTLVAKAGTPLREIEKLLASEGQRLAFEPMDHRGILGTSGEPTIGGVVAANVSGPRRIQAGACRDFLLGVRFVDGRGRVLKNGGRVMKNVTGYDLVKLMAGSFGTLGAITEVSFKTLPIAEASAVLLVEDLSVAEASKVMTAALGSPYDVTGASHSPRAGGGAGVTMIRIEGFEDSVSYRAEQLKALLGQFGNVSVENSADKNVADWRRVRDVEAFCSKSGDIWRISVKPGDGAEVGERLKTLGETELLYDWGGGLVWALVPDGSDVRHYLQGIGGHATLVRGTDETKTRLGAFQKEDPIIEKIAEGLRAKFDPRGIFNQGIMA